jgi:hypothetical protein
VRHEGTVNGERRIRDEEGDIADCLPPVLSAVGPAKAEALAKEGGFPPPLKLRRTGWIADLTAKNEQNAESRFGIGIVLVVLFVGNEFVRRLLRADCRVAPLPRWPGRRGDTTPRSRSPVVPWFRGLFANTLPNHCSLQCACNGAFLRVLRLFAAIQLKSLSMNNLQLIANFRNQGQSNLIKPNRVISYESPHPPSSAPSEPNGVLECWSIGVSGRRAISAAHRAITPVTPWIKPNQT